jgi:hypothetical protein
MNQFLRLPSPPPGKYPPAKKLKIRVASLALKEPNFSILASFDFVWLLKISFAASFYFLAPFWLLFE